MEKPKAAGLKWRKRKGGLDVPYWVASDAAVKAGYPVKVVRLTGLGPDMLIARCDRLQAEMLMWMSGRSSTKVLYDGTFRALLEHYLTDPDSTYQKLKPSSRHPYDIYAAKLKAHIGERRIDAVDRRDISRWFDTWSEADGPKRKLAAARMAICVLKAALLFGKGCRLTGCSDLQAILEDMEFPGLKARTSAPTADEIVRARQAARAAGAPLRALAYALQFETTLRQWDVIGQWVPMSDPRPSALPLEDQKWLGPTWAKIDDNLILKVTPTKTEETTEARVSLDLKECPMVLEELALIPIEQRTGPIIINEVTGLPYRHDMFRTCWRRDARAAGIPDTTWNRDLRAGGVTEGGRAGAALEDRARIAGHAKPKTTAEVYDRDTLEAARRVARARVKHRANSGGTEPGTSGTPAS